MKLILIITSAIGIFSLASCKGCGHMGNGKVVTQNRTVEPFTELSIAGVFPVEISQDGGSEFVKVEADENLQEFITIKNEGNKLIIKMDDDASIHKSKKLKVYININKLSELEFKSIGSLKTTNQLMLDSLQLSSESVGKMNLEIDAQFLHADLSSIGATTLKGRVHEVRINNKSVGTLSAYDLKASTMMIHNTAIGTVEIYADSAFYIRSSAVGTLYYKGPGQVKELSSEGIGKVSKAE